MYQGDAIEARLKEEYFHGLQAVMLKPAAQAIAGYLTEVNARAADLRPLQRATDASLTAAADTGAGTPSGTVASGVMLVSNPTTPATASTPAAMPEVSAASGAPYTQASSTNVTEAYNALKAYLMLGDRSRLEAGHMSDQLTRFWRSWLETNRGAMPREQLIQRAERIMSFALVQMSDPAFPQQDLNLTLLDQTRENLRRVVKGMPARERVYGEIKARAATRFAPVTVTRFVTENDRQVVAGSHAVSGAFTREAWEQYVKEAIQNAAHTELQSTDWVLKTAAADDLTLEGSPEQIQKALTHLYKTEYVREWQKFMQGITVHDFANFDQAVVHMNRLGDPSNSPVGVLLHTLYEQTSWDNPSLVNDRLAKGQKSFLEWFKQRILSVTPSPTPVNLNLTLGKDAQIPMGPIGQEFASLNRLMMSREGQEPLIRHYLSALSKIRSRFNQMKTQGDAGPASRKLMLETLEGSGELAEALKLVDEQLLNGLSESSRNALRPILVRPLMQAYGVIVKPAEAELNRVWMAQVFEPYQRTLANKYPFDRKASMEASPVEVAKVFGAEGAVSKFVEQSLGALVLKRGDSITPRTWADMGVRLRPEFVGGVGAWMAPLGGQSAAAAGGGASEVQTVFQMLPQAVPGLTEYTIEVDGQVLRYRNGKASWAHFVWPGPGTPGVKIGGVTYDGTPVTFFQEPGRYGLEKMINSAQRKRVDDGVFELRWAKGEAAVAVQLRIISNAEAPTAQAAPQAGGAGTSSSAGLGSLPAIIAGPVEPLAAEGTL